MADISKITGSNGTPYDIKDIKARGVVCTRAQYDAWEQAGTLDPDIDYHIPDGMPQSLLDRIYPVGSIYLSVNSSNPSSIFGGTWVQFGMGKTLVGVDANDTDFNTVEGTGGEKTHLLSYAESGAPAHKHTIPQHGHDFVQPAYSVTGGGVTNGITGGSHSHSTKLRLFNGGSSTSTGYYGAPYQMYTGQVFDQNGAVTSLGATQALSVQNNTSHTHNLPNHTHTVTRTTDGSVRDKAAFDTEATTASDASKAHNNLQPYITCYMWKRTA